MFGHSKFRTAITGSSGHSGGPKKDFEAGTPQFAYYGLRQADFNIVINGTIGLRHATVIIELDKYI
jgi:hypothetical protein